MPSTSKINDDLDSITIVFFYGTECHVEEFVFTLCVHVIKIHLLMNLRGQQQSQGRGGESPPQTQPWLLVSLNFLPSEGFEYYYVRKGNTQHGLAS